jgi:hypothetical protein
MNKEIFKDLLGFVIFWIIGVAICMTYTFLYSHIAKGV